jgi:hypothetical protein
VMGSINTFNVFRWLVEFLVMFIISEVLWSLQLMLRVTLCNFSNWCFTYNYFCVLFMTLNVHHVYLIFLLLWTHLVFWLKIWLVLHTTCPKQIFIFTFFIFLTSFFILNATILAKLLFKFFIFCNFSIFLFFINLIVK